MDCFVIYSENIKTRLDPPYLKNIVCVNNVKTKYPLIPLEKLLKDAPQYGANEVATEGSKERNVRYIRITDIDEFGNLKPEEWKTARTIEEKYLLKENDILFARSGATAGKTFIYKNRFGKAIFAGYLIRFKFDETKVNPLFVFYYTQLQRYALWVKSIQRPSGQPNINSEEFKAFEIPFPPLEIQNRIVSIMQSAHEQKKQKEQEAEILLSSIDDFVLSELGIKLPELQDKKCYVLNSDDIKGRFDPYYYKPSFFNRYESLKMSKYPIYDFRMLLLDVKNGVEIRTYSDKGNRYMRVTDLSEIGIIDKSPRYVSVKEIPERIKLTTNDFLISRSGSLGLVSVVTEDMLNYILSSHIFKITIDVIKLNPFYLQAFFRSRIGQFQFFQKNNGGIIPEINQEALKSIKVVVPPLDIQQKIADEVKERISKSEKLKVEANNVIEQAKKKVEAIILG